MQFQATCANCPFFQPFNENSRGWCSVFNRMAREYHQQTGDCENQLSNAESNVQTISSDSDEVEYALELEEKIERAATTVSPLIEIDADSGVYRVWQSHRFLGRFYRYGTSWVAEPSFGKASQHRSSQAAQRAVVKAWTS